MNREYIALTSPYNIALAVSRDLPVEYQSFDGNWLNVVAQFKRLPEEDHIELAIRLLMHGQFRVPRFHPIELEGGSVTYYGHNAAEAEPKVSKFDSWFPWTVSAIIFVMLVLVYGPIIIK